MSIYKKTLLKTWLKSEITCNDIKLYQYKFEFFFFFNISYKIIVNYNILKYT